MIRYIQEFRRPSALLTETGYYLTHLMSCLMFIETCNAEMLNVSEAEFDKYVDIRLTSCLTLRLMSVGPSSSVETPTPSMPTTTEEATTSATVSETSEGGTTAKPRESSKSMPIYSTDCIADDLIARLAF